MVAPRRGSLELLAPRRGSLESLAPRQRMLGPGVCAPSSKVSPPHTSKAAPSSEPDEAADLVDEGITEPAPLAGSPGIDAVAR